METTSNIQEPLAIVGFGCRLPGGNTSPHKLWQFLERGGVASNKVPESRFNIAGHWDGSLKPRTMRPLGGMFLEDIDPADFDASFFEVSKNEAISMDPNQRQMLEVVYEGLENAGITLESLDGSPVGCFVGSYASDYGDMQGRDPEDRPAGITVGAGRAILANRLSHFLNIKGPSMTLDTACSGSLVGLDIASRYLQSREINAAIIATSNLYLNPEHVMDTGAVGNAHSPSGICHTFDISADGYVKAEAVSAVIVKRLSDAFRDRDPIRAVIRGSSTNSDGRTSGIASPSAEAQAVAIRAAYANAGLTNLNDTAYLECHGTGTQAGDPIEVSGAGSVFSKTRSADKPLIIGSIKSNVGHAEPAAGISGLMKTVMAIEKGVIPGNPTFENPSPKIDFAGLKVKATKTAVPWPECSIRRASVNSFGYGGSNVHVVIDQAVLPDGPRHVSSYVSDEDEFDISEDEDRPCSILLSANTEASLRANIRALSDHLINPRVSVGLVDIAYTLSERRSHLFHRAFLTTRNTEFEESSFTLGKNTSNVPRIGFIFTGQGAQWSQMGKDILSFFPWTMSILKELDATLHSLPDGPTWSLIGELTDPRSNEHLRQPQYSQPLVTALQLCIIAVFQSWNIAPGAVVGHSSGEIAAAYCAGFISRADAIVAAYYRGRAALNCKDKVQGNVGMLAVGLGPDALYPLLEKYKEKAWVACFNSPSSLTVSGDLPTLEALKDDIQDAGHFARLLQVDLAYHSSLMDAIGEEYKTLLDGSFTSRSELSEVSMFSSVTGTKRTDTTDASYWRTNMVSPVRFNDALVTMLSGEGSPNYLIEIGPSGALAGPVSQILKTLPSQGTDITYCASWARGTDAGKSIFDVAGRLFVAGGTADMSLVNEYPSAKDGKGPAVIIDLPNYVWNHSTKYWHENAASKDWRFKKYVNHDLLGSKILGTSWQAPSWRKILNLADVPWLKDHQMGNDVLLPGSGYIAMASEAIFQKKQALDHDIGISSARDFCYRMRNIRFEKALVLEEDKEAIIMLSLCQQTGNKDWEEFRISSASDDLHTEHCSGLIRLEEYVDMPLAESLSEPLKYPTSGQLWYNAQKAAGYGFGPGFQKVQKVESTNGLRNCRSLVSLTEPKSNWSPQSTYSMHPASLDGCFQTVTPSLWAGELNSLDGVVVPSMIDDLTINKNHGSLAQGLSIADSEYSGRGRLEEAKSFFSNCTVYDSESRALLVQMKGLRFARLDTGIKPDRHTFDRISWKPDISFLSQDQLDYLPIDNGNTKAALVIDLIAHKRPALKVLEVNLDGADCSSLWFETGDVESRAAYLDYALVSADAKSLIQTQNKFEAKRNSSFLIMSYSQSALGIQPSEYDLIIVKPVEKAPIDMDGFAGSIKTLLSDQGYVLFVPPKEPSTENIVADGGDETPSTPPSRESPSLSPGTPASSPSATSGSKDQPENEALLPMSLEIPASGPMATHDDLPQKTHEWDSSMLERLVATWGLGTLLSIDAGEHTPSSLCVPKAVMQDSQDTAELCVASLTKDTPPLSSSLRAALCAAGWKITEQSGPFTGMRANRVVLVLDELTTPILSQIDAKAWDHLKDLIGLGNSLLWVTKGAQMEVTNPNNALAHGLFRVIRMEDARASLTTLDVQSSTSPATTSSILEVLNSLQQETPKTFVEREYAERGGIVHVHRVVPDALVNKFKSDERDGAEPVLRPLHGTDTAVSLRAERLGTFQSLTWCETDSAEGALEEGKIEVEIMAVGVNFKDVAVTMGLVPENEYTLGYEAAGFVKRTESHSTKFKVGDRVCFLNNGSYANRLQLAADRAHVIPDSMSFEDAATIPSVYLASMYSLFDIANLKRGQSVLIHSASGGVGIACIQLARYMEAEIYVTVGTQEKRDFLANNFGIDRSHMFSSRDTKFAKQILNATNGRGIDIIINSLTGEMLDESWRLCADGGTLVEIGKKDIVERNMLSMEPFDRNCSFRAMDFSYTRDISNTLISRLLDQIFDMVNSGHLKPIRPVTTFGFDEVPSALAYIRSGRHIGKVVISNAVKGDTRVAIRPAMRSLGLRSCASYLIVGGLKGLCGNLAIYMAQHGAKHIIVCSRSGIDDNASKKVSAGCMAYGCQVVEARGDVADVNFLRRVFKDTSPSIAGIVQGAMILRDKPYETMTLGEWRIVLHGKVAGTWRLHQVSQEQDQSLDFFTMLSSISGIVGKKGQANYSAANTFLDSFATYRQSLGCRANAVDLGLIEGVGYVAEQGGMDSHFDKRQWTPIIEGMLRKILSYSILQQTTPINPQSSAQLVTGIGFPLPSDSDLSREARFSYLFVQGGSSEPGKEGSQGDQTIRAFHLLRKSGADKAALVKVGLEILAAQFTKILRLDVEMEPGKSLTAYGLDSLAAVELRNWVRIELGAELTTIDITNASSLVALCEKLVSKLPQAEPISQRN